MKNILPKIIVLIVALGALTALILVMLKNKEKVTAKLHRKPANELEAEESDLECCCEAAEEADAQCDACECEPAEEAAEEATEEAVEETACDCGCDAE